MLTHVFYLISVNQTLCRLLIGCGLHLLPVEEAEESSSGQSPLARSVALVNVLDFLPLGGRELVLLHPLPLHMNLKVPDLI